MQVSCRAGVDARCCSQPSSIQQVLAGLNVPKLFSFYLGRDAEYQAAFRWLLINF